MTEYRWTDAELDEAARTIENGEADLMADEAIMLLIEEIRTTRAAERARRIATDDELHAVARGVVVRAKDGTIAGRFSDELGVVLGSGEPFAWKALHAPAEILFDPTPRSDRG